MGRVFTLIYDFFHRHRTAFVILFLILLGTEAWFGSQIRLEEDINRVIPASEKNRKLITVLQHSKFADRLVVCITQSEQDAEARPGLLIDFAESLIDSLENTDAASYISSIESKVSPESISEIYRLFYENLPLFLEEEDYHTIEDMLSDSAVALAIRNDYQALISPGGFVMREFILKDPLSITPIALKKLESLKLSENFELYNDYILSKDRRNLLFFIIPANPSTETSENAVLLSMLNNFGNSLEEYYRAQAGMSFFGSMAASVSNASQIKADIIKTVSIAAIVLIIFIGLYFRRKAAFLLIFIPAILGGGFSIAFIFLLKSEVSAISLGLGSVMLGISVDYALHFLSHLRQTGSVRTVINDIASPVIMSSITTASAFMCLLVLRSEALRDLGLFAAVSVLSSAVFTLTILPHFFKQATISSAGNKHNRLAAFIGRIASYRYDRKRKLLFAIILLFILFFITSGKVKFESNMDNMNYLTEKLIRSENHLDSISSYKLRSVFLVSSAGKLEEALVINESIIPLTDSLLASGIVKSYTSIHAFYPSENLRNSKIERWNEFWDQQKSEALKSSIGTASEKFRFKENTFSEFFKLLDPGEKSFKISALDPLREAFLDEYITEKDSLAFVSTLLKVAPEDKPAIYDAFEKMDDIIVFDRQSLTSSFMDGLRHDFNMLIILSLAVVFLILTLSFGRIELGIITLIPLLISWTWTLGIMGLLGIRFNIFNIIISTFIFGLGIDYAIFIMRGLLQEYKYGRKKLNSYKTSILLSGITTLVGIGVLIFARHPALQSIAVSAIIGITSVIFITYTLLPRLFRFLVEHEGRKRHWPVTLRDFIFSVNTFLIFLIGVILLNVFGLLLKYAVPIKLAKKKMIFHRMLSAACWTIVYGSVNIKKIFWNRSGEDFKKPAVVICNHQSHLDTVLNILQNPRMLLLTAPWVQKSIFFGWFIRFADFYPVTEGLDPIMDKLRDRVNEGYSIFVFPEGTRSVNLGIGRFHQGAFHIAKELNLEILPIISYGSGNTMPKFEPFLKTSTSTMTILPRIKQDDPLIKDSLLATSKSVRKYMKKEYAVIRSSLETPVFYRKKLIRSFLNRGPVLEWYMKIKIRMEDNYLPFHKHLPENGLLTDIGCGYGFMSYMLYLLAPQRRIMAYDYDRDKIDTANHCALKNDNIQFHHADVSRAEIPQSDAFILADVLHYMPEDEQEKLITKCTGKLNDKGVIIIRDANAAMKKKHLGTRISELFSTHLGFNKTIGESKKLYFISKEKYLTIFSQLDLHVEIIDETKMTSNIVYVLRKKQ
jgi:1-acyl-sn-glycerol-3-phosphate acyltransferase